MKHKIYINTKFDNYIGITKYIICNSSKKYQINWKFMLTVNSFNSLFALLLINKICFTMFMG